MPQAQPAKCDAEWIRDLKETARRRHDPTAIADVAEARLAAHSPVNRYPRSGGRQAPSGAGSRTARVAGKQEQDLSVDDVETRRHLPWIRFLSPRVER